MFERVCPPSRLHIEEEVLSFEVMEEEAGSAGVVADL